MTDERPIVILDPQLEHTARMPAWQGIGWKYEDAPDDDEDYREWAERERKKERGLRYDAYMQMLPKRYQRCKLENLRIHDGNRAAVQAANAFDLGDTLYLWGRPGNGKTHIAAALGAMYAWGRAVDVEFWNLATLFHRLRRAAIGEETWPNLAYPSVLVLDDIGKTKGTDFTFQEFYRVLEERWSDDKATIFTANHRPSQAVKRIADDPESQGAILSRLAAGTVVEVKGPDQRIQHDAEKP